MKVLHVLLGLDSGGAERIAANLMRTLNRVRFGAGLISLLDPPVGTDLTEILAQEGILVWHLGKRQGFDPRIFVRLARFLDRVGCPTGSALSLHPRGLAQRAPALDEHEGLY
jgi:hypothetical protein